MLAGCGLFDPFPALAPDESAPLALEDDPRADAGGSSPGGPRAAGGSTDAGTLEDAQSGDACSGTCDAGAADAAGADASGTDTSIDAAADAGVVPGFGWATSITTATSFEYGPAIAVRPNGDAVLAFSGQGAWQSGAGSFPATGAGDIGLIFVSAAGEVTSTKRLDLGGDDFVRGAAFDASGNLWLAGHTEALSGSTNAHAFVQKRDATATTTLVSAALDVLGTTSHVRCASVAVGSGGHVAVACNGRGTVQYTKVGGAVGSLVLEGTSDGIVARIDPTDGRVVWIAKIGAEGYDLVNRIAVDAQGAVYVTGSFESPALSFPPLTRVGLRWNAFVAKLSATDGSSVWAANWGDAVEPPVLGVGETDNGAAGLGAAGHAIAVDAAGHVVVGGRYRGTTNLVGDQRTADPPGFVVLLLDAASGARAWSKYGRGSAGRGGSIGDLAFDDANNLGVVGSVFGAGPANIDGEPFSTYGNTTTFAAKMSVTTGAIAWVTSAHATAGSPYVEGAAVRFLPSGALVFGVQGTAVTGSLTIDLGDGVPIVTSGLIAAISRGP